MVHRWGISVGVVNLHAFHWAVMWRGKPTQQLRTEAIGGFIATLPLRHVQSERREGPRKSYSLEAGREGNELRLCGRKKQRPWYRSVRRSTLPQQCKDAYRKHQRSSRRTTKHTPQES